MAEANVDGSSDFKCGICLSEYTEPRLLDCYHIFCTPCLDKLRENKEDISCPLCRTKIILPHEGVGGLKLCPFFGSQKPRNGGHIDNCDLCSEENIADVKCMDCQVNLCLECREYHKKLKTSKNHKLTDLESGHMICRLTSSDNSNKIIECVEHKKDLTLFCKPCNNVICTECNEKAHVKHEVESLMHSAAIKRDNLLTRNSSLKSKIPLLENYIESVKMEEANVYKSTNQIKKEIRSHASCLKELVCKTIDIMARESLDHVERNCRTNAKNIEIYTEELEVEKMSLSLLQKTTEVLINSHSEAKILKDYFDLSSRLDEALQDTEKCFPSLKCLKFEQGIFGREKMQELFGEVVTTTGNTNPNRTLSRLTVPKVKTKPRIISSFQKPGRVLAMAPSNDDKVWMCMIDIASLHGLDGTVQLSIQPPDKSTTVLQKPGSKEIWFWCGQVAKNGKVNGKECYKVESKGLIGCCFLANGNLLLYNPADKSIQEVSENGTMQRRISNTQLQTFKTATVSIAETKILKNLIISGGLDTILIADKNGQVKNTYQRPRAEFRAMATDNYGKILVVDFENDVLTLLSEEGAFLCDLLSKIDGLFGIDNMTIDECGHLWLSDRVANSPTTVKIFSYL